jgi:hypothetical protein
MPITPDNHRSAVANYLAGKIREFGYQLRVLVKTADHSAASFLHGNENPDGAPLVYAFSALGNAMQSLKDALKTTGAEPLSWGQIAQIPHGEFMAKSRNAMTHDGNPVINAWVDGRYFVANDISRYGPKGEPIEIIRPQGDVRTICLTFANGFCSTLSDRLQPLIGNYQISGANFDVEEIEIAVCGSDLIPPDVKALFTANKEQFRKSIVDAPSFDPVVKAIDELKEIRKYCKLALGQS